MSIQALAYVFDHSPVSNSDRLVLLSIANHAGQETWEAWPSVALIAKEANCSKSTAQKALARLERDGHIERIVNGAPDRRIPKDRRPNLYRVINRTEEDGVVDSTTPVEGDGVANSTRRGSQIGVDGVVNLTTQTVIEPSSNQKNLSAKDADAISEPDPVDVELCEMLASEMEAWSRVKPNQPKGWVNDMRLLRERGSTDWAKPEPIEPERIRRAIRWATTDTFWRQNVRSPAALRRHWAKLSAAAQAEREKAEQADKPRETIYT